MPTQPGGIDRVERLNTIERVVHTWGPLERSQIEQHLETAFDRSGRVFKYCIPKDLNTLVQCGKLHVRHYKRDGEVIENYDPMIHLNTTGKWDVPRLTATIAGERRLHEVKGRIVVPRYLLDHVEILDGGRASDSSYGFNRLFFAAGDGVLCLAINSEAAVGVTLTVGRFCESGYKEIAKTISDSDRRIYLLVSGHNELSRVLPPDKTGHFSIQFANKSPWILRDHQSKAGTRVWAYASKDTVKLANELLMPCEQTLDSERMTATTMIRGLIPVPEQGYFVRPGSVIRVAENCHFIIDRHL